MLEIGPGDGALTEHLAGRVGRLIAVELDTRAVGPLRERFADDVEILAADFLAVDLDALARRCGRPLRVVGNIPYNITTPILFHVLDHRSSVRDLHIMVQREVARRLVASPGGKDYGILAVFCRMFTDAAILFDVSPGCFVPTPSVTSSVVRLTMLSRPRCAVADEGEFRRMVRTVFGKRRKILRNTLKEFLGDASIPADLPVDLGRRPEQLTVEELAGLCNALPARSHGDQG